MASTMRLQDDLRTRPRWSGPWYRTAYGYWARPFVQGATRMLIVGPKVEG